MTGKIRLPCTGDCGSAVSMVFLQEINMQLPSCFPGIASGVFSSEVKNG